MPFASHSDMLINASIFAFITKSLRYILIPIDNKARKNEAIVCGI